MIMPTGAKWCYISVHKLIKLTSIRESCQYLIIHFSIHLFTIIDSHPTIMILTYLNNRPIQSQQCSLFTTWTCDIRDNASVQKKY